MPAQKNITALIVWKRIRIFVELKTFQHIKFQNYGKLQRFRFG